MIKSYFTDNQDTTVVFHARLTKHASLGHAQTVVFDNVITTSVTHTTNIRDILQHPTMGRTTLLRHLLRTQQVLNIYR